MLASGLRPGKEDGMGVSFILLMSSKHTIILAEEGFKTKVRYCLDMEIGCINPVKMKRRPLYLKTQSVPRCKHFSSRL